MRRQAQDFPPPPNTERAATGPVKAAEAAAGFRVPEGFRVTVFAAEPDVQNPIAMAWDAAGGSGSPRTTLMPTSTQKFDLRLRDRVLIFEDSRLRTAGSTAARSSPTTCSGSPASSSVSAASGSCARPACCLSPTAMATTSRRSGRGRSRRLLGPRARTITPSPTACAGAPTAGCTAAAGPRPPARSESRGRLMRSACPSAAASGAITRAASGFEVLCARHDQSLGPRLERAGRGVLHQHGQRPPLAHDPRRALRPPAYDRAQPAGPMP